MSQAGIASSTSGPVPPFVPINFVTDVNSPSIPIANIENIIGGTIPLNNTNGIQTDGSSGSNTLTIQLTNRFNGSVTTTDATPTNIEQLGLAAIPGVYNFTIEIAGFSALLPGGVGFSIFATIRTDGVNATIVDNPDKISNIENTMAGCDVNLTVSGNIVNIVAIGILASINWYALGTYVKVI